MDSLLKNETLINLKCWLQNDGGLQLFKQLKPGKNKKSQKNVQMEIFWPFLFCDGFSCWLLDHLINLKLRRK